MKTIELESGANSNLIGSLSSSIDNVELPPSLSMLVEAYETLDETRDPYLWHWLYAVFPLFRLSCVSPLFVDDVLEQKVALTMFVTMLDDVAERDTDRRTFEEARKIPFPSESVGYDRDGVDQQFLQVAELVWETLESGLEAAPRYDEFEHLLRFDLRQAINAMDYSLLLSECLDAATLGGCEQYDTHNMVVFSYVDIDLMHSPMFDRRDLGELREVTWDVQMMARIGNWVTTWERELEEGDFSSGVVVYALRHGIVTAEELRENDGSATAELAERIRNHRVEEYFMAEWEARYGSLKTGRRASESVDVDAFVEGMREVMGYHLASRGRK